MEKYYVFADESGTDWKGACYAIGCFIVPRSAFVGFSGQFYALTREHRLTSEVKWADVKKRPGLAAFARDLAAVVARTKVSYSSIVVRQHGYRIFEEGDYEGAFYRTYTHLMADVAQRCGGSFSIHIDDRNDSYPKQVEVMKIVGNHMLRRADSSLKITLVEKQDSKLLAGIQAADLITGAIRAAHQAYLSGTSLEASRSRAIQAIASTFGWDALHYDTWPNPKFNIWHFPRDFRAMPRTVSVPKGLQRSG